MRAQINSQMVSVIAILVAAIVLFAWVGAFAGNTERQEKIELCRLSILAASKTKIVGDKNFIDFDCPRWEVEVKEDDVTKNGEVMKTEIARTLAEEARICHYQVDRGRSNPFKQYKLGDATACLICSDISFEESLAEKVSTIRLGEYMESTKMCKDCSTYATYLSNHSGVNDFSDTVDIDLTHEYYLIYAYISPGKWVDSDNMVGTVGNWLTGWAMDNEAYAAIQFVRKEELETLDCNFIAN
ncbi:MAG: hypothetical protein ACQESG_02795 [Nanobdellota archaeon]